MLTSNYAYLIPELMDVVRLFEGAEDLFISHTAAVGEDVSNVFLVGGKEYAFRDPLTGGETERKSLVKRYAKLGLYLILSETFQTSLPWGSLTGIRPTRLAYQELGKGRPFEPLFEKLKVSEENIALVRRVLRAQQGIYEKKEGNCDLFVSLPFCPSKCSYCSFITAPIDKTRQYLPAYLETLTREIEAARPLISNLRSVYIGGGTPFVLSAEELETVLKALSPLAASGAEYTVEAGRPDVFTPEKLNLCKEYGVTRICINAQSFSDETLRAIGRKHTRAQLFEAFEMAEPFGFDVNCDLIAGLTGESAEEFKKSVDEAIGLSPANITVHTLCLKKGARLKEERLVTPARSKAILTQLDGSLLDEMIAYSRKALTAAGYEPYYLYRQKYMAGAHENVGWTKKGHACIYNVDVMEECCDNLAVGSNAISKRVILSEERIERIASPKDIPTYLEKADKVMADKEKLFR